MRQQQPMKDQQKFARYNNGYIALTTVLVVGVVLVTIGLSVSLLAISEGQLALSGQRNEKTLDLVEGCVEVGLLQFRNTSTVDATIVLPEGTCSVTVNGATPTVWDGTVVATAETVTKKIRVKAIRATSVAVTSWLEVL